MTKRRSTTSFPGMDACGRTNSRRQKRGSMKILSSTATDALLMLALTIAACSMKCIPSSSSMQAFAFSPIPATIRAATPRTNLATMSRTICNAKLNKLASNFDLDQILANEKEFTSAEEEDTSQSSKGRGRRKDKGNDNKKKMMKEQLKKQKMEKQQLKKKQKSLSKNDDLADFEDDNDDEAAIEYETLIRDVHFSVYEVPPSCDGKRIDSALVELLNDNNDGSESQVSNPIPISRSQCGTLVSHECVFVVAPEDVSNFRSDWLAHEKEMNTEEASAAAVPYSLIEQYGSPIQRKSHVLETSSILIYPSRDSLLSTSSSSALLSNFIAPTEIVAQKLPLDILFEDEHMIVINKQAGMVVHPAAGNWDKTVVNALAYYLMNDSPFGAGEFFAEGEGKDVIDLDESNIANSEADVNQNDAVTNSISTLRPGIVHRLDKGTTGVLVVAKTSSALATLSEAFAERKVKKQYLAVAIGNPGEDQWIDKPIGRHPLHRQRMRVVPDPNSSMANRGQSRLTGPKSVSMAKQGRQALSHIHTIHYDGKLSVVQVQIATGRTHQIRVHLQDHGTPIYGDDVYGLSDWNKALSSRRGITRPLLHAQRLEIDHPVTGETMVFEAEVANDMMGVIKAIWPAGEKIEF